MQITTSRFANLEYTQKDIIKFEDGILGFEEHHEFMIVDPADDTNILWLQSLKDGAIAFPMIEPKIFKPDYKLTVTPKDLNSVKMESLEGALVYSVLTIPSDITKMTANLKAPVVINPKLKTAKQIVLQDSKLEVDFEIYAILKAYIIKAANDKSTQEETEKTL